MTIPHIIHVTEDHSWRNTGVTKMVDQLMRSLGREGYSQTLIAGGEDAIPAPEGVDTIVHPAGRIARSWGWSGQLGLHMREVVARVENPVIHLHGVWMAQQWLGARIAYERKVPFAITAHGMLKPWMWHSQGARKYLKKAIYWNTVARPVFQHAACIHVVTPSEYSAVLELIPSAKLSVIPHHLEIDNLGNGHGHSPNISEPYVMFLGRLHPVKGIDLLVRAFALAGLDEKWRLLIVGPEGCPGYRKELIELAGALGLSNRVTFQSETHGDEKWQLIRNAWVVASPSYSEILGMVNLESAACGTPTIATTVTELENWQESGGLVIEPNVDQLTDALRRATAWALHERQDRGQAIRRLIETKYSWHAVRPLWDDFYQTLHNS